LRSSKAVRTLFLGSTFLPDSDIVEANAHFGDTAFVPFAFSRLYPHAKLYPFTPPLDYTGLQCHTAEDSRHSIPLFGDWRDVKDCCLSAPTEVLRKIGGFDESCYDGSYSDLAHRLCERMYRLIPMWSAGYTTQLGDAPSNAKRRRKRTLAVHNADMEAALSTRQTRRGVQ
jgi:hypothetical protein